MNIELFAALFISLSIFYFILGLIASKRIKTTTDYFLAGRNLGVGSVMATLMATQIGGGMLLGTSQDAYEIGIYGIVYTLGMIIGFFLLAFGFAAKMRATHASTTAQLFEIRYNSPFLRKIASLFSIITLSGILVAQVVASHTIFVGLELNNVALFMIFWLLIIVYTMAGGLEAVVITDMFQVTYIIVVFVGLFLYCVYLNPSSLTQLISYPPSLDPNVSTRLGSLGEILLIPALFALIEQDLAQRFFSAKNKRVATLAASYSALFMLAFACIPVYFGIQARVLGLAVAPNASPLLPVLEFLTNGWVTAFALCGIAAAITSTADSLLCAISSNIAQDFNISMRNVSKVFLAQLVTLSVGLVALVASFFVPQNIIGLLVNSYKISVSCLFIPLVVSYFAHNLNKYAAGLSMFGGLIGYISFTLFPLPFANELAILGLSALGYAIGIVFFSITPYRN
jgi:solute:Na+ symporter, SSS family